MDMSKTLTYTVELKPLQNGGYLATVPALPGCVTEGDSYPHAIEMAREAIEAYLAVLAEAGDPIPEELPPAESLTVGVRMDASVHS